MLAGAAGMYTYRKIEAQFESFILSEVARKGAEAERAIEEKLEEEAQKAIAAELVQAEKLEEETVVDFMVEIADEEVPLGAVIMPVPVSEDVEASDTTVTDTAESNENQTSSQEVDSTESSSQNTTTQETTTNEVTPVEVVPVEEVTETEVVEETVEPEPVEDVVEPVEIYTKDDFERDKKIALDLAMSRLSASQISHLIDISSGGFTSEEKQDAKEMFYSNFSAAEQDWILGIYSKYYSLVNGG